MDAALPAGHVGGRQHAWPVMRDDHSPPANWAQTRRDRAVGGGERACISRAESASRSVIDAFPARLKSFEFRSSASAPRGLATAMSTTACRSIGAECLS